VTPEDLDPNHIEDAHMKKLEALKKALSEGTYAVSAEDLAPKIMQSMLRDTIFGNKASGSQLAAGGRFNPQDNDGQKIPGGEMVSHKESGSVSVPSDRSPGGWRKP
jgi:Anti-sigma-28 factor, FlgM